MAMFSMNGQFGGGFNNPNFAKPRLKLQQGTGGAQDFNVGWKAGSAGIKQAPPLIPLIGADGGGGGGYGGSYGAASSGGSARGGSAGGMDTAMFDKLKQLFGGASVDPTAAIESAQPGITRQMTANFNEAANRLGQAGMLGFSSGKMAGGTPYQDLLGQAAGEATDRTAELRNKYAYDASKSNQGFLLDLMRQFGVGGGGVSGGGGGGGSRGGYSSGGSGGPRTVEDIIGRAAQQNYIQDAIGRMNDPLYDKKKAAKQAADARAFAGATGRSVVENLFGRIGAAPPPGQWR